MSQFQLSSIRHSLLGFLIAMVLVGCGGSGPGAALEEFFEAVDTGDLQTAADGLLRTGMWAGEQTNFFGVEMESGPSAMVREFHEFLVSKGGVDEFDLLWENTEGEMGSAGFRIRFGDGVIDEQSVPMVRTEEGWKFNILRAIDEGDFGDLGTGRAQETEVQAALRNLITIQERFYGRELRYFETEEERTDAGITGPPVLGSNREVHVEVSLSDDGQGYSAVASHELLPGRYCEVSVGGGAESGRISCSNR